MRDATSLPESGLEWLEADGPFAGVVLSTRVRLARNLGEHRFGLRADEAEREAILLAAKDAAGRTKSLAEGTVLAMRRVPERTRRLLLERHLVSKELIGEENTDPPSHSALLLANEDALGVM